MVKNSNGQTIFWIVFAVAIAGLVALLAGGVLPSSVQTRATSSFWPPSGIIGPGPDVQFPGGYPYLPNLGPEPQGPISFGPGGIVGCGSPPGSEPCPWERKFPPPDTGGVGGGPICSINGIVGPCPGGPSGFGGRQLAPGPGQPGPESPQQPGQPGSDSGGSSSSGRSDSAGTGTGGCGPEEKSIIDYIVDNNGERKPVEVCVKPASPKEDGCPASGTGGWDWFERQGSSCIGHMNDCPIAGYVRDSYNQCVKPVTGNKGKIIDVIFRPEKNIARQCTAHESNSDQCGNALVIYQRCKDVYDSAGLSSDKFCS